MKFSTLYIFIITFLIPIDWFTPTGELFREFGAKPVSLLLLSAGALFLYKRESNIQKRAIENTIARYFIFMLLCGILAFFINISFGWSYSTTNLRDPIIQFLLQLLLILAAFISIFGNARIIAQYSLVEKWNKILPLVASIHLFLFALEAAGIIHSSSPIYELFHTSFSIGRPTGLTSEPSYFGTLAALFGTGLIFNNYNNKIKKYYSVFIGLALYTSSIYISSKTFFGIVAVQYAYKFIVYNKFSLRLYLIVFTALIVFLFSAYIGFKNFDVYYNLSSSMRLGSLLLALKAAFSGYALLGIGIGQFHFFYREEFAPSFLMFSKEAIHYFDLYTTFRASTFNFYIKVFLELGIIGFIIFKNFIVWMLRCKEVLRYNQMVEYFFIGALAFLFTQDTYYYPPFILASSLIIGEQLRLSENHDEESSS